MSKYTLGLSAGLLLLAFAPLTLLAADYNTRDLGYFVEWFEGDWDNDEQTYFQGDRRWQLDAALQHGRLHTVHRHIELPAFGDMVFYIEEYKNDDTSQVTYQGLAVITSNPEAHTWTQENYSFKKPAKYAGAHYKPELLDGLKASDTTKLEGCAIIWRRDAGQFVGETKGEQCIVDSPSGDARQMTRVALSEDRYWRTQRAFDTDSGTLALGHVTDDPFEFSKVTEYYSCTMRFMEGFYDNEGARAANYQEGEDQMEGPFVIPSQGGEFSAVRKQDGLTYSGRIRSRQYPYYPRGSDFTVLQARRFDEKGEVNQFGWIVQPAHTDWMVMAFGWLTYNCKSADAPF